MLLVAPLAHCQSGCGACWVVVSCSYNFFLSILFGVLAYGGSTCGTHSILRNQCRGFLGLGICISAYVLYANHSSNTASNVTSGSCRNASYWKVTQPFSDPLPASWGFKIFSSFFLKWENIKYVDRNNGNDKWNGRSPAILSDFTVTVIKLEVL